MTGPDVVILLYDFAGTERNSYFRVTRSWSRLGKEAEFLAALNGLGAAGGSELVVGAGTVGLDGVFGNEKLGGDLAIAEAAGDQGENFELTGRNAERLLAGRIGSEGFEGGCGGGAPRVNGNFPDHDSFADGFADSFATSRDSKAEPDAEG